MPILTPTHIANRALQRVGATRIADGALLTEDSKNASEIRSCYDILRRAELRRNVWRFAIRTVALRPFDDNSKIVTFGTYAAGATYVLNDVVTGTDGVVYRSLAAGNIGNTPASSPSKWEGYFGSAVAHAHDTTKTYYAGELVHLSSVLYMSKISANADLPPTANWLTMTTAPTLSATNFIYPIGAGPSSQTGTKKTYQLPVGFLREAPQDPKNSSSRNDWTNEGRYIVTDDTGVILYRFVTDVLDVDMYDPLFVEGFASRIAFEICEPLTQSTGKIGQIASEYGTFMGEARIVNGIETGSVEAPIDDYISIRA